MPASRKELQQAPFVQLFRLDQDPGESKNLAAKCPEKVRELFEFINQQISSGRSTSGPAVFNDRESIDLFRAIPSFVWRRQSWKLKQFFSIDVFHSWTRRLNHHSRKQDLENSDHQKKRNCLSQAVRCCSFC